MKQIRKSLLALLALLLFGGMGARAQGPTTVDTIELTKSGANQWTLGQTPDYDVELQVEYYQQYALKNIPEGWTVKINGAEQQTPYTGDSLLITETDSVTLVPDNPRRVKSVTLADEPQNVNIDGITLLIAEGDTWQQIADRNPGKVQIGGNDNVFSNLGRPLKEGSNYVNKNDTYNPSLNYYWMTY